MESPHHPSHPLKVHRAAVCFADGLPDRALRKAARTRFGAGPILVVGVSSGFYRRFGETDHQHPLRLVAHSVGSNKLLVLLLQFGGHQLRCVMSLRQAMVRQMFCMMKRQALLPLLVFDDEGHRYAGLECEVPVEDLRAIDIADLPALVPREDCRAELAHVALSCLLIAEMPSIVPDEAVKEVDVALVE